MSKCTYTTQGIIICSQNQLPVQQEIRLEHFVDMQPNMKESNCSIINKKLSDIMSPYNCSAQIQNKSPKCTFQFDCEES